MQDPLVGTWILNVEKSEFGPNHRPKAGTMVIELDVEGYYRQSAHGLNEKGEKITEQPFRFIPDGREHPMDAMPGLKYKVTRTDSNTITGEATREDGTVVGGSTTVVSPDGNSKIVTNFGFDSQLRQFKMRTVWDRQS